MVVVIRRCDREVLEVVETVVLLVAWRYAINDGIGLCAFKGTHHWYLVMGMLLITKSISLFIFVTVEKIYTIFATRLTVGWADLCQMHICAVEEDS